MPQLSVNLDVIAALREIRSMGEPDPTQAAVLAELAHADGIAVQFRQDRRQIRERDLYLLKGVIRTKLIVEISPGEEFVSKALNVKPWMVTIVADHADSATPVSTIDFTGADIDFRELSQQFSGVGINVAYFVEPEPEAVKGAARAGGMAVLINCSSYSGAPTLEEAQAELDRIDRAVQTAVKNNVAVYCGRGLHYKNVRPLVELGAVDEFVIGHAICSRAMLVGIERAVKEMLALIQSGPQLG